MDTQEPPPTLLSLPNDVLAQIVELLWRWQDAAALSQTCKRLRWLAEEVFRRWDLNWKEEKAWLCLTRPDEVRAFEVTDVGDWRDWWKRICDSGAWDLLEWLAAQPVMREMTARDVWRSAWKCAKHEDGVRGLRWAVEHFGEPSGDGVDARYVAQQRWASKAFPFLRDAGVAVYAPHFLLWAKHEATVAFLVDRGAQVTSQEGLMACAACGDTDGVERALAAGVDVNAVVGVRWDRRTALHVAKDGEMVRLLVSRGANLEARDRDELTPLLAAASDGRLSAAVALQECGADVQSRDDGGWSALHFAAQRGDQEMLLECLEWGLDVNGVASSYKPLHFARDGVTVRFLVAHGADVATNGELTPYHHAALVGDLSVLEALRACGVDVVRDRHDITPLHTAAQFGRPKAVAMLLEWGLQVDARDEWQETPLFYAVTQSPEEARFECMRLLLAHGADPEARSAYGQSVREKAREVWPEDLILRVFGDP